MPELRRLAVEAMAKAHHEMERRHFHPEWPAYEELGTFGQRTHFEFMSAALDSLLDTLTVNAEAWIEMEAQLSLSLSLSRIPNWRRMWIEQLRNLIAVLRPASGVDSAIYGAGRL